MAEVIGEMRITAKFDSDKLHEFVGRDPNGEHKLTQQQLNDIADTLVANLESPVGSDGDEIDPLDRSMFNDSYGDMKEDMQEEYRL